ncbi:MAG: helix-turn-helix transcriptional regulator [Candidatus Kapaibacteriales bacterium]
MPGQAHRILFIYRKLLEGEEIVSSQLQDLISEEIEIVSIRTIQRDLRLLQKLDPSIVCRARGKELIWYIPKEFRIPKQIVRFSANEVLAFYFLKAHLKTFKGTVIEEEVEKLINKIEQIAPKEAVLDETIYWDQNIGYYDYSKMNEILEKVVQTTTKKLWVKVTYSTPKNIQQQNKEIIARFETIFSYLGLLYVVAYIPKHKVHVSLAIHNISAIEELTNYLDVAPAFSFREWSKYRFGVFSGEISNVKLLIKSELKHFFLNRKWHITQSEKIDKDGNLILEMKVPVGADLINWILSWSDAIIVLEPEELINKIRSRLQQALDNYKFIGENSKHNSYVADQVGIDKTVLAIEQSTKEKKKKVAQTTNIQTPKYKFKINNKK